MRNSISQRLRFRLATIGGVGAAVLLAFVAFDIDRVFDTHYATLGGVGYEIADHVVLPFLVLLLPMMVAIPWVIRSALKPLEDAAARVDAASGMDRGFQVDLAGLPDEATPFVQAVNSLLERLDEFAEHQEALAADIAHELKTPMAIVSLELEELDDPVARKIRADVAGMNRLIEQLMLIAQLDAATASRVHHDQVALQQVAEDVVSRLAPGAIDVGVRLELEVEEQATVFGRREAMAAALRNLIENAIRVTPRGQPVTVIVGPGARIRVRDGGPGISPDRLAHLSKRLTRADNASLGGAGLGLSIVTRIMASHGGRLETNPSNRELQLVFDRAPG